MATILVVDDEMGIRGLLSEILTDEGHSVELAENAAQARAVRERMRPDLVLLDIWMPDVDGVTLAQGMGRQRPADDAGDHDERPRHHRHRGRGDQVRRLAFLEKPVTLQKLLRAVEQSLAKPAPRPAPSGSNGNGPSRVPHGGCPAA